MKAVADKVIRVISGWCLRLQNCLKRCFKREPALQTRGVEFKRSGHEPDKRGSNERHCSPTLRENWDPA